MVMAAEQNPNIKILVSCHKEVPLPKSDLYLPIQVGAANASSVISGMQPDNAGENISGRNFSFCELSAQYWAWKNLEADYYGLCHYRRYFCFDGIDHPANDHLQIEADSLSDFSIRDYQINNESLIREALQECDIVTPPYWDVSKAPTPAGVKNSVQEHMIAFGLYTEEDAALVRSIIEKKQPEYLNNFDSYMSGNKYLGYSCYIMNKEYFNRFCEFEFSILLEFDRRFDYSNITSTRKRIAGYFGEVLYSVFISKIIQEGEARIKQVPLVFFLDTSPTNLPSGKSGNGKKSIQIYWRYRDRSANAFEICIESLIEHFDSGKEYDLTVLYDTEFILDAFNNILPSLPSNLRIAKTHWSNFVCPAELTDLSLKNMDIVQPLLLPWLTNSEEPMLWIDGLVVFNADPALLLEEEKKAYSCAKNVLLHRELNKPLTKNFLGDYNLTPKDDLILDTAVTVINPKLAKQNYTSDEICGAVNTLRSKYRLIEPEKEIGKPPTQRKKTPIAPGYLLENQAFRAHLLLELNVAELSFGEVSYAVDVVDTAAWLNEEWANDWISEENPIAVYLEYGKPPILNANQRFGNLYWKQARKSDVYEVLLGEVLEPEEAVPLKIALFPEGSKRRKLVKALFRLGHR